MEHGHRLNQVVNKPRVFFLFPAKRVVKSIFQIDLGSIRRNLRSLQAILDWRTSLAGFLSLCGRVAWI